MTIGEGIRNILILETYTKTHGTSLGVAKQNTRLWSSSNLELDVFRYISKSSNVEATRLHDEFHAINFQSSQALFIFQIEHL